MTISAFLEAAKKRCLCTFSQRMAGAGCFVCNAAPEIEELRNLCRKITDSGRTVSEEDVERVREIVK